MKRCFTIENYEQKVKALESLMQKYQKEGGYKPLNDTIYKKIINATSIYKIVPENSCGKFHMGQDYNEERFERVCSHLKDRGTKKDLATLKLMQSLRI